MKNEVIYDYYEEGSDDWSIDLIDDEENNIIDEDNSDDNWLLFYMIFQNKLSIWLYFFFQWSRFKWIISIFFIVSIYIYITIIYFYIYIYIYIYIE